jgi:hypothetical protein
MQRGSEKRPNLRTRVRCEPQCRVPYSAFTCSYTTTVPVVAPVHGERRARRTNSGSASTMALKWAPAGPASHGRYSSTLLRETVNHTGFSLACMQFIRLLNLFWRVRPVSL